MVLALLILFLAIANVSAEDTTGNLTVASDVLAVDEVISLDDNIYHITNETFNDYIADGEIADDDMIYEFEGDFEELGVLYISGNNITVKGSDANFVDTVFYVIGDDNTLVDINMEVFTTFKDMTTQQFMLMGIIR
jgi:hypothetical protein